MNVKPFDKNSHGKKALLSVVSTLKSQNGETEINHPKVKK